MDFNDLFEAILPYILLLLTVLSVGLIGLGWILGRFM